MPASPPTTELPTQPPPAARWPGRGGPGRESSAARVSVRSITQSASLIPLFYAGLLYLSGIVVAHFCYLRPSFLLCGLLPLAATAWFAIQRAPRLRWLPIAAIWIALGAWSAETEAAPAADPAVTQLADGLLRTVEGTVTDAGPMRARDLEEETDPDVAESDSSSESNSGPQTGSLQRVDLELSAAEFVTDTADQLLPMQPAKAPLLPHTIRLNLLLPRIATRPIACGQRLLAVLRILPPEEFRDPGVWSRATYLESEQISAIASVSVGKSDNGAPRFLLLDKGQSPSSDLGCRLNRWRDLASDRLQTLPALTQKMTRSLPLSLAKRLRATPADAAMLTALLTGDRTFLTRGLRGGFERTGSFHLIVVSGLHLAILAGLVFALARRMRLHRYLATALTLAIAFAYALFTGFGIPAQRSFWMIALYLAGRLLYRNRSPLNVLGFAVLCMAAHSPRSIFEASLQMTVLAVASISGLAIPLLEGNLAARLRATQELRQISFDAKFPPRIAQFRVTLRLVADHLERATNRWIAWKLLPFLTKTAFRLGELLFVTLVVELALALPMAMYFHRITVYALPVNLVILPLLGLLIPAAMLVLVLLSVWPAAAMLPAALALAILHSSLWIVRTLGGLSLGNVRVPEPSQLQTGIALVLFVVAILLARSSGLGRPLSLAALALSTLAALFPRPIVHPQNALLFEALDVGQGDSLLLISPDGKTLLVDAGGLGFAGFSSHAKAQTTSPSREFDVGEEVVSATLWSRGIRHLDAVALTHAHHDHMGGMAAVLRNFHPKELWVGNNPVVPEYEELLETAAGEHVSVRSLRAGENLDLGQLQIHVLAPAASYRPSVAPGNNDSLVLRVRFKDSSILLMGDAEAPEEQAILATLANGHATSLQSTILKIGHHGSVTSTRPAFLQAVKPPWAVLSCGRRNRFGHPRPEVLAELQAAHTRTFRTDIDGATCFLLNGQAGAQAVTPQPMCMQDP